LLLTAFSPVTSAQNSTVMPHIDIRVTIPNNHNLQWMNFGVAQGAGYFAGEGIAVETTARTAGEQSGSW
jgi:ABC-type nitrate/sulfonate/bicarbonate transport system substrate-binding protein